jgi:hypothetical protein
MDPFSLSMLQQAINMPFGSGRAPAGVHRLPPEVQAAIFKQRQQLALQNMPPGLPRDQQYAYLVANHIAPASQGFSGEEINRYEQAQMYDKWNNQTGGMQNIMDNYAQGGYGKNQDPNTGQIVNWSGNGGHSNIGGGAGNPNNAAGGLYGSAGNALRQMFMDSQQFNPNGANTYAIQNMNLSGLGDLGSNMGGMPSNGLFGGAVPATALGNGQTSTNPIPTTPTGAVGTQNPGMGVQTPQSNPNRTPSYFGGTGGGLGGGQHNVIQGGVSGGANGTFTGTIDQNGATQYRPPTTTTTTPTTTNYGQNPGTVNFGGGQRRQLGPRINQV